MRRFSGAAVANRPRETLMPARVPADIGVASQQSSRNSLFVALASACALVVLSCLVGACCSHDHEARQHLLSQSPAILYQMSACAFFTALVLNLTSLVFEDSAAKRTLALLSCVVKAAACSSDLLIVYDATPVLYDSGGSLFIPQRYVQWIVTTPLMVFILSQISDFSWQRLTATAAADVLMVFLGAMSHLMPGMLAWGPFLLSSLLFVHVMTEMAAMVGSAIEADASQSPAVRRSLQFICAGTLLIWSLFPVAWLMARFMPQHLMYSEALVLFANFTAKVMFSSSIMYGNYYTIAQRRLIATQLAENEARITMVHDLKEAVTRKDQFMSLMSHELRTPLNGIIQLSDALCRGAGGSMNPKGNHFMQTIKNSSNHLLNIINDILDVAALKEGKLHIKHELVDLSRAIDHVVDIVAPLAKKEVSIERVFDPRTPMVVADFSRMVQIMYNLLGNSLKFTKSGYVRVSVGPANPTGCSVLITVEDTGIGIPADKMGSIWGAFEQVDMSVTRKFGGTGLGLNIVKQLVSSHHGTITCASQEGQGATFTILLPTLQTSMRESLEGQVRNAVEAQGYNWDTLHRGSLATHSLPSSHAPSLHSSRCVSSDLSFTRANTAPHPGPPHAPLLRALYSSLQPRQQQQQPLPNDPLARAVSSAVDFLAASYRRMSPYLFSSDSRATELQRFEEKQAQGPGRGQGVVPDSTAQTNRPARPVHCSRLSGEPSIVRRGVQGSPVQSLSTAVPHPAHLPSSSPKRAASHDEGSGKSCDRVSAGSRGRRHSSSRGINNDKQQYPCPALPVPPSHGLPGCDDTQGHSLPVTVPSAKDDAGGERSSTFALNLEPSLPCERSSMVDRISAQSSLLVGGGTWVPGAAGGAGPLREYPRRRLSPMTEMSMMLRSTSGHTLAAGMASRCSSIDMDGQERLLKKRTMELEHEVMLGDLARRTAHNRSLQQEANTRQAWRQQQGQAQELGRMSQGGMLPPRASQDQAVRSRLSLAQTHDQGMQGWAQGQGTPTAATIAGVWDSSSRLATHSQLPDVQSTSSLYQSSSNPDLKVLPSSTHQPTSSAPADALETPPALPPAPLALAAGPNPPPTPPSPGQAPLPGAQGSDPPTTGPLSFSSSLSINQGIAPEPPSYTTFDLPAAATSFQLHTSPATALSPSHPSPLQLAEPRGGTRGTWLPPAPAVPPFPSFTTFPSCPSPLSRNQGPPQKTPSRLGGLLSLLTPVLSGVVGGLMGTAAGGGRPGSEVEGAAAAARPLSSRKPSALRLTTHAGATPAAGGPAQGSTVRWQSSDLSMDGLDEDISTHPEGQREVRRGPAWQPKSAGGALSPSPHSATYQAVTSEQLSLPTAFPPPRWVASSSGYASATVKATDNLRRNPPPALLPPCGIEDVARASYSSEPSCGFRQGQGPRPAHLSFASATQGSRTSSAAQLPGSWGALSPSRAQAGLLGGPSRMSLSSAMYTRHALSGSMTRQSASYGPVHHSACNSPQGETSEIAVNGPPILGLSMDKLAYSAMYGTPLILSVDDEEVNQIVAEEILTSAGYKYARAMDGREALQWLAEQETLPDLVMLDCMMPVMSGHEFCATLRKVIPGSVLPVIMVSAKSDEENIVEGLRSGSNDFVRKPFCRDELLARIETQLRLKSDSWWLAELVNNQDGRETESMKLLKNILPESIIQRMQSGQKFVADSHQHVVILFSDIVGFTNLSSKLPTAEIFLMLSNMFSAFDKLTDRFMVYKVETIGDAYMVAAGHDEDPVKAQRGTPIDRVIAMAKAMIDVVRNITAPNGDRLRIRIGVHCGPAFAGVIGSKCPRYCFLGDTVNTASRMESTSFPMVCQVSSSLAAAWEQAPHQLVHAGDREVKGKGVMTTYLLKHGEWQAAVDTLTQRAAAEAAVQKQSAAQHEKQQQQVPLLTQQQLVGAREAVGGWQHRDTHGFDTATPAEGREGEGGVPVHAPLAVAASQAAEGVTRGLDFLMANNAAFSPMDTPVVRSPCRADNLKATPFSQLLASDTRNPPDADGTAPLGSRTHDFLSDARDDSPVRGAGASCMRDLGSHATDGGTTGLVGGMGASLGWASSFGHPSYEVALPFPPSTQHTGAAAAPTTITNPTASTPYAQPQHQQRELQGNSSHLGTPPATASSWGALVSPGGGKGASHQSPSFSCPASQCAACAAPLPIPPASLAGQAPLPPPTPTAVPLSSPSAARDLGGEGGRQGADQLQQQVVALSARLVLEQQQCAVAQADAAAQRQLAVEASAKLLLLKCLLSRTPLLNHPFSPTPPASSTFQSSPMTVAATPSGATHPPDFPPQISSFASPSVPANSCFTPSQPALLSTQDLVLSLASRHSLAAYHLPAAAAAPPPSPAPAAPQATQKDLLQGKRTVATSPLFNLSPSPQAAAATQLPVQQQQQENMFGGVVPPAGKSQPFGIFGPLLAQLNLKSSKSKAKAKAKSKAGKGGEGSSQPAQLTSPAQTNLADMRATPPSQQQWPSLQAGMSDPTALSALVSGADYWPAAVQELMKGLSGPPCTSAPQATPPPQPTTTLPLHPGSGTTSTSSSREAIATPSHTTQPVRPSYEAGHLELEEQQGEGPEGAGAAGQVVGAGPGAAGWASDSHTSTVGAAAAAHTLSLAATSTAATSTAAAAAKARSAAGAAAAARCLMAGLATAASRHKAAGPAATRTDQSSCTTPGPVPSVPAAAATPQASCSTLSTSLPLSTAPCLPGPAAPAPTAATQLVNMGLGSVQEHAGEMGPLQLLLAASLPAYLSAGGLADLQGLGPLGRRMLLRGLRQGDTLTLQHLLSALGLSSFAPAFQHQGVHLYQLLAMEPEQVARLGGLPLGHCLRVYEAVQHLARFLLFTCEAGGGE